MSKQHVGIYTDDEVEELRSRYSNEKVAALVAEAKALDVKADEEPEDLLGASSDAEGDQGEGEDAEAPEAPVEEAGKGFDYSSLTVPELGELLKARELTTSGNKPELVARLQEDDASK